MNSMRNVLKLVGVCLLLTLAVLGLGLRTNAQTPATPPTVTFNLPNGATIHQSDGFDIVKVTANYPTGFRGLNLTGAYSSTSVFAASGKTVTIALYFFVGYYPAGDYPFTATAIDANGKVTMQTITLHLVE